MVIDIARFFVFVPHLSSQGVNRISTNCGDAILFYRAHNTSAPTNSALEVFKMKNQTRLLWLSIALAAGVFGLLFSIDSVETVSANAAGANAPIPAPTAGTTNELKVQTFDGVKQATFEAPSGKVLVYLPDDMRAGDTISGTVVAEPKGQTPEERAKNLETLNGYTIKLWPNPPKKPGEGVFTLPVKNPSFTILLPPPPRDPSPLGFTGFGATLGPSVGQSSDPSLSPSGFVQDNFISIADLEGVGQVPQDIRPPSLGQQGRPLEIPGPFDGSFDNTTLRFGPVGSTVQDFEKNTQSVSGGFGLIKPLAESPRKLVFESPTNVVGPIQVFVQEGDRKTTGTFRNLAVNLSAPKTNLMRGERTVLTVEVLGLKGLKDDVPLQIDSRGVISMDGGNFQNLRIKPSEVTPEGRYITNRAITGVRAGGFEVTATVIVRPFDFCLQDDADRNRLFYLNSFTGDYFFACGGGSCGGGSAGGTQTGGTSTSQPGGSPPLPPVTLSGVGKPAMKGCIITLSHNAPDRRVFARLDACTKTGEATVQTNSPKAEIKISDKNTADNTATSTSPR
jgi:hypothetical protein